MTGHWFSGFFSFSKHVPKKSGRATVAAAGVTVRLPWLFRGKGRIWRNTLSPVVFGLVCVPWKWMLAVLDACRQLG